MQVQISQISKSVRRLAAGVAMLLFAPLLAMAPVRADAPAAQPAHKAFVLIEYQVRDQPLFLKLRETVRDSLKSYKGDIVTREKVQPIFGGNPTNLSVISFPSIEAARTWLASKELAAIAPQRDKAAKVTTYLVEKLD